MLRICYYEGPIECTIKDVSLIHIKLSKIKTTMYLIVPHFI